MHVRNAVLANQEQYVRDQEIDPALFTPKDQMRDWMRAAKMPAEMDVDLAQLAGAVARK
jgi:ribonuclease Z